MLRLARFAFALTLLETSACGGNVVVDQPGSGGAGGTSTSTITLPTGTTTLTTSTVTTSTISTSTVTTGTTTTTTTTTSSSSNLPCGGTVLSGDTNCQGCIENACCAELAACTFGTPCETLWSCFSHCKAHDSTCQSLCFEMNANGVIPLQALASCSQASCGIDQLQCLTPVCDSEVEALQPLCGQCLSNGCCEETKACVADSTCLDCLTGMSGPECMGSAAFNEIMSCFQGWCGPVCF